MEDDIDPFLFIIGVVVLTTLVAIIASISSLINDEKLVDMKCRELHYDKSTDFTYINNTYFSNRLKIECDNIIINDIFYKSLICIEYDKWNNCIKEKEILILENYKE